MKKFNLLAFIYCLGFLFTILKAQSIPDYGERSFASVRDSISLVQNFNVAATEGSIDPDEYIVGPGDKIFISISGMEDINFNLVINQEGSLYIPKVGGIDLNKTTLSDAKKKILAQINKYYKNIDVFISLADFRKIKVSLIGDVKKPTSYILNGNARLIDLIMNSAGLNETSNYRNIKIINRENDTVYYDLLSYLRFGKRDKNPLLHEGDIVIIDKVDKVVTISGLVKYPGVYEYVDGESALDLILLSGGFINKSRTDTIEVVSFNTEGKAQLSKYYSYEDLQQQSVILKNQDLILVREIPEYFVDQYVSIEGYIKYPGTYKIIKDQTTLKDLISEAGGFRENASLNEAILTRSMGIVEYDAEYERLKLIPRSELSDDEYDYLKAKSRQRRGRVIVDFIELFQKNDLSENVVLRRGDVISIPEAKNYIIMLGQVVNPGNIVYKKEYSIDDYIKLAGGFGWRAIEGDVRVVKANTGEWIDADDVDSLDPGDTIWVPEDPPAPRFWDVFTTSLTIVGQLASIVAATMAVIIASRK